MKPLAKALKNKVIGITSDVLSAPARYKAYKADKQATKDVALLKKARSYDNAPDEANNGEAGMVRSLARDVKDKYKPVSKVETFKVNGKEMPYRNDRQRLGTY